MQKFIDHIKQYINLSEKAENDIKKLALRESIEKGYEILAEGKTCKRIYFIEEGTIRTFFFLKGKDITHWVYPNNSMVTSWYSYIMGSPSSEYLEATEDSVIISLSYDDWQFLFNKHPELERFMRNIMETQIATLDDFYKGYYFLSAKEKYELLINNYPSIVQRANLGHIASMLGISQETLSRIRGK